MAKAASGTPFQVEVLRPGKIVKLTGTTKISNCRSLYRYAVVPPLNLAIWGGGMATLSEEGDGSKTQAEWRST